MQQHQSVELADGRQLANAEDGDPNGIPIFFFGGFPGSSRLESSRFHEVAVTNQYRLFGIDRHYR